MCRVSLPRVEQAAEEPLLPLLFLSLKGAVMAFCDTSTLTAYKFGKEGQPLFSQGISNAWKIPIVRFQPSPGEQLDAEPR